MLATFDEPARRGEAFAFFHPDIEWDTRALPDGAVVRGHAGVRDFWRSWLDAWESIRFEYTNWREEGDDVVVTLIHLARGRASGVPTQFGPYLQRWTVRDGLIVRMRVEF